MTHREEWVCADNQQFTTFGMRLTCVWMTHSEHWVRADNQQFTTFGMRLTGGTVNNSLIRRLIDQEKYLKIYFRKL